MALEMLLPRCRLWNHVVGWGRGHSNGEFILARAKAMSERYSQWMEVDRLTALPPPPAAFQSEK